MAATRSAGVKSRTGPRPARPYDVFAEFYDRSYLGWRGESAYRQYAALLGWAVDESTTACDLACGTGALALELARKGLTVYAVDNHPAMAAQARARARTSRGRMRVLEADMRRFQLPEKVGLIACMFDAVNHLTRRDDLHALLTSVRANLLPGGYFCFDVNTVAGVRHPWPAAPDVASGTRQGRKWCRIARALPFDGRRLRGGTSFEWFLEGTGGRFRRVVEEYWEIAWRDGAIDDALEREGFTILDRWDGSVLERGLGQGLRTYYRTRLRAPTG